MEKEEKAREYADGLMNSVQSYYVETWGMERAKRICDFDIFYVEQAYLDGWDAMLCGLLTNVKKGNLTRTRRLSAVWCQTEHS